MVAVYNPRKEKEMTMRWLQHVLGIASVIALVTSAAQREGTARYCFLSAGLFLFGATLSAFGWC